MRILITGSGGLVGSEAALFFLSQGHNVVGIDNDTRNALFGESVNENIVSLKNYSNYKHYDFDIRDFFCMSNVFSYHKFDAIIHTAAQPSHDLAASMILDDFAINATATLQLLELTSKNCPGAVFIYTSTNKVYGDYPNKLDYTQDGKRLSPVNHQPFDESTPVDNQLHSFFGCSKLAADLYCQEYGKNFGLKTNILRLGCITGSRHQGAKLHGFLNYLVKCLKNKESYEIIGYGGLQVRDNIHAKDLVLAFDEIIKSPTNGEVFNLGGGEFSNCSILESIDIIKSYTKEEPELLFNNKSRVGDHIWYISDNSKFKTRFPNWKQKYNIYDIIDEIWNNIR